MYEVILSEFKKMGLIDNFYNNEKDFLDNIHKQKIVYYCNNPDKCLYFFLFIGEETNFPVINIFYSNTTKDNILEYKDELIEKYKNKYKNKYIKLFIESKEYNISNGLNLDKGIGKYSEYFNNINYFNRFVKNYIIYYNLFCLYNSLKNNFYLSFNDYFLLIKNETEINNITLDNFHNFFKLLNIFIKLYFTFVSDNYDKIKIFNSNNCLITNINTNICIEEDECSGYLITQKNKDNLELLILSFYFDLFENGFNVLIFEESNIIIDEICHNLNTGKLYNIAINFSKPYKEINNKFNQYLEKIKEENSLVKILLYNK